MARGMAQHGTQRPIVQRQAGQRRTPQTGRPQRAARGGDPGRDSHPDERTTLWHTHVLQMTITFFFHPAHHSISSRVLLFPNQTRVQG